MNDFTHLDDAGQANMVDVSGKAETERSATAQATILLSEDVLSKIRDHSIAKGDLLATARIAGIQAAKQCAGLIPLCHPLPLDRVHIDIDETQGGLTITAKCKTSGKTGVEMEALTAASIAGLTIYDMCKALDKGIVMQNLQLLEKHGGKSGSWVRGVD